MHYEYSVLVQPENDANDPVVYPVKLAAGVLTDFSVFFAAGCNRTTRVQLWDRGNQILPTNRDGYYSSDDNTVVAKLHYDIGEHSNKFYIVAWAAGSVYDHTITVDMDVRALDDPDVTSLVGAMINTTDRLIALIRSMI